MKEYLEKFMPVILLVLLISVSLVNTSYSQPSNSIEKSSWPEGVRSLTFTEGDRLGVDSEGNLYWDGKRIQILNEISLKERDFYLALFGVFAAWVVALKAIFDCYLKLRDGG